MQAQNLPIRRIISEQSLGNVPMYQVKLAGAARRSYTMLPQERVKQQSPALVAEFNKVAALYRIVQILFTHKGGLQSSQFKNIRRIVKANAKHREPPARYLEAAIEALLPYPSCYLLFAKVIEEVRTSY